MRSEFDRWPAMIAKVGEYLAAGVLVVGILDPDPQSLDIYTQDKSPQRLAIDDELILPEVFPDFRVAVRQFFE